MIDADGQITDAGGVFYAGQIVPEVNPIVRLLLLLHARQGDREFIGFAVPAPSPVEEPVHVKCPRCGGESVMRLAALGQGTSERFLVGCRSCRKIFRSPINPEGKGGDIAACHRQIEANRCEAEDLLARYARRKVMS